MKSNVEVKPTRSDRLGSRDVLEERPSKAPVPARILHRIPGSMSSPSPSSSKQSQLSFHLANKKHNKYIKMN